MPQTLCYIGVSSTAKMQEYYKVENVRAVSMSFKNLCSMSLVLLTLSSDASLMVFVFSLGEGKVPRVLGF